MFNGYSDMSSFSLAPRDAVITGVGMVCPLGLTARDVWNGITEGRCGIRAISLDHQKNTSLVNNSRDLVSIGAPVRQFTGSIEDFGSLPGDISRSLRKGLKLMCRESQMAVAAALRALDDAGWKPGLYDPQRCGVIFGCDYLLSTPEEFIEPIAACVESGKFQFSRWGKEGPSKMNPLWLLKYLPNMPASHIAIYCHFCGPTNSITLREASGLVGLGEAQNLISRGLADLIVVGATGSWLQPMKLIHALTHQQVVTNGDPEALPPPFDRGRRGMVLGEGAAAVVVEAAESAMARGCTIYGRVVTTASAAKLTNLGKPDYRGALELVLRQVLTRASLGPGKIGFISAQGLGTHHGDREEAQAIAAVFADRDTPVPVVAGKSYLGYLGASSAVVELIVGLFALASNRLYRVRNLTQRDPECPIMPVAEEGFPSGDTFIQLAYTPQAQAAGVLVARTP
jgi:3-oxoacyl-[acyl-carrier-protein] synthase II